MINLPLMRLRRFQCEEGRKLSAHVLLEPHNIPVNQTTVAVVHCFCPSADQHSAAVVLRDTELEDASIGQIRLRLFKIAARFKVSVRRIHIELCSAYPLKRLFVQIHTT
jgi:Transposase DDE domain group 1